MQIIIALALLISTSIVSANDPSAAMDGVLDLSDSTFELHVGQEKPALVEFYAPWCGHCKALVPEYTRLGAAAKKAGKVIIAKVNAEENSAIAQRYGVTGFPTIKYFPAGSTTAEDYTGGRTATDFASFLKKKAGVSLTFPYEHSNVVTITPSTWSKIVNDETKKCVLVEFYAPWCGHCKALAPKYELVAKAFASEKAVTIAKVDADAHRTLGEAHGVKGFPTVKLFTGPDESEVVNVREVQEFVTLLNTKCGTQREESGDLMQSAGVDATLTSMLQEVAQSKSSEREELVAKVERHVGTSPSSASAYYLHVAKKSLSDLGFISNEYTRLRTIIARDNSKGEKRDLMVMKRNILSDIIFNVKKKD